MRSAKDRSSALLSCPLLLATQDAAALTMSLMPNPFEYLPDEMVRAVFAWLGGDDLARLSCTSSRMRGLVDDSALWESLCRRSLGAPNARSVGDRHVYDEMAFSSWLTDYSRTNNDNDNNGGNNNGRDKDEGDYGDCRSVRYIRRPPPIPELPPSTLCRPAVWRWLYVACHQRIDSHRLSPSVKTFSRWSRWRPWHKTRRPAHTVSVQRGSRPLSSSPLPSPPSSITIRVGDLDDHGHLSGFGLRAVCSRSPTSGSWRWSEWTWGTWSAGQIDGLGRMCASSGATHTGRFDRGVAHGRGVRAMPTHCQHDDLTAADDNVSSLPSCSSFSSHAPTEPKINRAKQNTRVHAVEIVACWRAGKADGRVIQTTDCGDVWVSLWRRGTLVAIESLLLPPRPCLDGRPAFGGMRIERVPWRIQDVASATAAYPAVGTRSLFAGCFIALPAEARTLDLYMDYVRAGHPCLSATMASAVLAAGARFREVLSDHSAST
jgi:hypothetical protein